MPERRGSKRTSARLKVWCEGDDFTLLAETVNVSKRGLFVRTSSPPPAAQRGMGLHIVDFERGGKVFEDYVDKNSSRSGEHKLAWPSGSGDGGEHG